MSSDHLRTGEPVGAAGGLAAGLRLAVGTLTMVPVGQIGTITPAIARVAMTLAPLAVLPIGLGCAAICFVGSWLAWPGLVTAGLTLAFAGWASRGMHLDGFADTIDGFAAGWSRERALEVMRKGDVGPLGVVGLLLLLLVQAAAISELVQWPNGWLLVGWAVIAARWACALVCRRGVPAARPDGLGVVVTSVVPIGLAVAVGVVLAVVGAAVAVSIDWSWWEPVLGLVFGALAVWWLTWRSVRVLGGVTGDIIGAAVELLLVVILIVLSVGAR